MSPVQALQSDIEASRLLPGGDVGGLALVLFCRPSVDQAPIKAFTESVPPGRPAFVIDVDSAPSTCRWFGVRGTPVLAAIADGALLMLETECGAGACQGVLDAAVLTLQHLDDDVGW